jgi:hypothetical protein
MNAIIQQSAQVVAGAREERACSIAFWGLNPADYDVPDATDARQQAESAAVSLLSYDAALSQPAPVFRRLQRRLARTWLREVVRLLRGERGTL